MDIDVSGPLTNVFCNDCPYILEPMKKISVTRILQVKVFLKIVLHHYENFVRSIFFSEIYSVSNFQRTKSWISWHKFDKTNRMILEVKSIDCSIGFLDQSSNNKWSTTWFQVLAKNRAEESCHELIDCLLANYKPREKTDPITTISGDADVSENSSIEIYRSGQPVLNYYKRLFYFYMILFLSRISRKIVSQSTYETLNAADRKFHVENGVGGIKYWEHSDISQYSKWTGTKAVKRRARCFTEIIWHWCVKN